MEVNLVDCSLVWEVLDQPNAFEKRHCGTSSLTWTLPHFARLRILTEAAGNRVATTILLPSEQIDPSRSQKADSELAFTQLK
jgi:hypothetical protein